MARKSRWMGEGRPVGTENPPLIFHCISRVVSGQSLFGAEERDYLRAFMRAQERFSGCQVLAYCLMPDHLHILLEIPSPLFDKITDGDLIRRLEEVREGDHGEIVAKELAEARAAGDDARAAEIHARYTYRMNNLSEFMKTFLQRFTRWYNGSYKRKGTLWEARYMSVVIESGLAARTLAGYIDLNSVRAGLVEDPAEYPWCSYGEAVSGKKGSGREAARKGLVRAWSGLPSSGYDREKWKQTLRSYREFLGLSQRRITPAGTELGLVDGRDFAPMLRKRIRYFSEGVAIGSKDFVEDSFKSQRARFSLNRKDGARPLRGNGKPAADHLWSLRDLRTRID